MNRITNFCTLLLCSATWGRILDSHNENSHDPDPYSFQHGHHSIQSRPGDNFTCSLSQSLLAEIQSYANISQLILSTVTTGAFKGTTYEYMQIFVDRYHHRVSGSDDLEESIDYMMDLMRSQKLNVSAEQVEVPKWIRGDESAFIVTPRRKKIALLGLGYTVSTPPEGITAEILVVRSFDELRANASKAAGKIIVFNQDFVSYNLSKEYRSRGATEAAKVGGIAALIRSITPFSMYTPHTGSQHYELNVTQIPAACITVEDAQLLHRLQKAGQRVLIQLSLNDTNLPSRNSRNSIGEIRGDEKPDEYVVVSGHIDSWDVGQGVMDDAGGVFISTQSLALLQYLGLRPRRTLRAILWTAEEFGLIGAERYVNDHRDEMDMFKAVLEADVGTFRPLGLDFAGTDEAGCIVQEVLKLLAPINATEFSQQTSVGSDITHFASHGVPTLSLRNANSKYFYFHHTEADTMTLVNSDDLDLSVALWATASYVLADLSVELPRRRRRSVSRLVAEPLLH